MQCLSMSDHELSRLVERTTPMYYDEIIVDERLRAEMLRPGGVAAELGAFGAQAPEGGNCPGP